MLKRSKREVINTNAERGGRRMLIAWGSLQGSSEMQKEVDQPSEMTVQYRGSWRGNKC